MLETSITKEGAEARTGVNPYLEFYNQPGPHQGLGYRTPADVYQQGNQQNRRLTVKKQGLPSGVVNVMNTAARYVGINVAKAHRDIAVHPSVEVWQVSYDTQGITNLLAQLAELAPTLVVLEAAADWKCT